MNKRAKRVLVFFTMLALTRGGFCAVFFNVTSAIDFEAAGVILSTNSTQASISATVNPTAGGDQRILTFANGTSSNFAVGYGRTSSKYFCFGKNSSNILLQVDSSDNFSAGIPHNVICTAQQSNLSLYVDGVFEGSNATLDTGVTFGGLSTVTGQTCRIGRAPAALAAPFLGTIDDVRAYSRVLSQGEIMSLGESRSRVLITDGCVAYWPLDNMSGTVVLGTDVLDRSGNNHNGVAVVSTPNWIGSFYVNYP